MQSVQHQSHHPAGRPIAGLLWLGLAGAVALALAQQATVPLSGLALAIALLTLFVAAIVATFSLRYMRADNRSTRFFLSLGAMVVAVLGFLASGNLIAFAAAWVASGWLLAALIGHAQDWQEAKAAAGRARIAFLTGDAALILALSLLGWQTGSLEIATVLSEAANLPTLPLTAAALLLVIAAAARCALPPFAGWLLSSMTAPTPVSALMHAGLVNAGGFLLIRFAPVLEAAPAARAAAILIGLCAAIYGLGIMMVRPDIKRSLAGSTVSQMGFMIMSCGLGAYAAAIWHIIAHGLFKAWLFLGSGSSVGMKASKPAAMLSGGTSLLIAAATLGVALSIFSFGQGNAGLIPLLLGLATASATLVASLGGQVPMRAKLALLVTLALLIAFHSAGLALTGMAVGPDAAQLVPDWAMLALLAVFLAAWVWQQHSAAAGRALPLPLYVHFLNAGLLPATASGVRP